MNRFTPRILVGVVVLFLVVGAGLMFLKPDSFKGIDDKPTPDSSTLAASAENSGDLGEYYDGKTASASVSATPVPLPKPLTEYIYPGSKTISSTVRKLELQTNENPTAVTDWYKNKIKGLSFNAQSFSSTNTNGVVFNKLSAAKPGEKIEVTIKKDQTTSVVSIAVDRL